uniref:Uncharacterized protein n=1 Tax=viral metagenome TaxID=1070528 RepID=A0A6C0E1M8_9ZZZZ
MNKMLTTIESVINDAVNNYISVISKNYNINEKELNDLWYNNKSDDIKSVASKTSTSSKAKSTKKSDVTCIYKYIKGKQEGQLCGKNAKADSNYCTKHLKFETEGQKEKKNIIPKEEVVNVNKIEKCIRFNKDINKWWHQETKLIFKSNLDKVVVGIYKNDNIEKLNDDDCHLCEKYGFKYSRNELDEPVKKSAEETPKKSVEPVNKSSEETPKKSVEPVKKSSEETPKKSVEPVKKSSEETPKKSVEPVKKSAEAHKKLFETPKKTVETLKTPQAPKKIEPKKKISEQILETNFYAKNVEDVIGDMLDEVDGDDEDDADTLEDEVLEEDNENFDFDEEEEEILEEDDE